MRAALPLALVTTLVFGLACGTSSSAPEAPQEAPRKARGKAKRPSPERDPGPTTPIPRDAVRVKVLPDGSFEPARVEVKAGQTVAWELSDRYRDSIAPLEGNAKKKACRTIAPYEGGDDDFTGPMPRNPSGIFVLNSKNEGLQSSQPAATFGEGPVPKLKETGPIASVMDHSWESDGNVGAFLRLQWDRLQPRPGEYDWSILDREVAKAVANGKLYSLSIKAGHHATPPWIFDKGVEKLVFRDAGSHEGQSDCKCGFMMALGSPTDKAYQKLYFEMLEAVAAHLKENAAAYRHLAYIKPSGANLFSNENRLPKRCNCPEMCSNTCDVPPEFADAPFVEPDGRICNSKVWAKAGYTVDGLYDFYDKQTALLARAFPDKDMMYMLIHGGFPQVTDRNTYLECGMDPKDESLPHPSLQTKMLIKRGYRDHKERMAVQHAGARDTKDVNHMLTTVPKPTQIIGLQTTFETDHAEVLGRTFARGTETSRATMFEIYEEAFWDADWRGQTDPSLSPERDLVGWNDALHERRRAMAKPGNEALRDPFPTAHLHTFASPGTHRFVNPRHCGDDAEAPVGEIVVVR